MPYIAPVPITHSSVAGNVPNTADELVTGALAVNLADGALYTKDYAGAIVRIEGDGGNATIASATTLDLGAIMAGVVDVTGTTPITAISLRVGQTRTVRFTGALTLTHGANLVLPGAASITTAAGDFATFRGYAGGLVRCTYYSSASIAAQIHAAASKVTPVDADELPLADSAATFGLKKLTWANLKAAIKAYLAGPATLISDWNDATGTGPYMANSGTNAPFTGWFIGNVVRHDANWVTQEIWKFTAGVDASKYKRQQVGGVWSGWVEQGNWSSSGLYVTGTLITSGSITVGNCTLATLPAHQPGKLVYVSDAGAGAKFQGSNGTAWVNLG